MARKATKTVKVDSVRHKDKRKNIPTEELRSFVAADEAAPKTITRKTTCARSSAHPELIEG